jgi:prolipoprotein diacylglyceryltransferase
MAGLLAVTDSFVVRVVQGAVGSIERSGDSFRSWMVTSAWTMPIFVLAVLGALAVARRRFGPALHTPKNVVMTALMIAFAGAVLGAALVVTNTAYDYHLQSQEIRSTTAHHGLAHHGLGVDEQLAQTLSADEAGARYGSRLIVIADVVIVAWVTAMRGGRLDVARRRPIA